MNLRGHPTVTKRREALAEKLHISLTQIGSSYTDEVTASTKNCENMIGVITVPVGVAGPLQISSDLQHRQVFVPLATTEGALVASVNRGCKAISLATEAHVTSKRIGITRAPVFVTENTQKAQEFGLWVEGQFEKLQEVAARTSSHLQLLTATPFIVGRNIFLRLSFDTQDAMGMNMATIATTAIAEYIEQHYQVRCAAISSNVCVDKKPNVLNFIEGRGYSVTADVVVTSRIIMDVLKTDTASFLDVCYRKLSLGSIISGTIGSNAQAANVLAALFLATGQDIAHIAECASALTTVEQLADGNIYVSVTIPDLVVGTVGGGTGLATQKEALQMLGIAGGDSGKNAQKLAEIAATAVLAGEISLLASLAEKTLAKAHKRLGRGGA